MSKLHYIVGDATLPAGKRPMIAHVVNNLGYWGKGFSGELSRRYPETTRYYQDRLRRESRVTQPDYLLGTVFFQPIFRPFGGHIMVAHMVAQRGLFHWKENPVPLIYGALYDCLLQVANTAFEEEYTVHMPKIGAGLARGFWQEISTILEQTVSHLVPTIVYLQNLE